MQSIDDSNTVLVAFLYQSSQFDLHLKDALNQYGAKIVYESSLSNIDRHSLQASGAMVVIVNLDGETDISTENIHELLGSDNYEVLINDGAASSSLQGWDYARWERHLAAKVLKRPDIIHPPRPAGAEAVPVPRQKTVEKLANFRGEAGTEILPNSAGEKPNASVDESLAAQRINVVITNAAVSQGEEHFSAELDALFADMEPSYTAELTTSEKISNRSLLSDDKRPWVKENEIADIPTASFGSQNSTQQIIRKKSQKEELVELEALFKQRLSNENSVSIIENVVAVPSSLASTVSTPLQPSPFSEWSLEAMESMTETSNDSVGTVSNPKENLNLGQLASEKPLSPESEKSTGEFHFNLDLVTMEETTTQPLEASIPIPPITDDLPIIEPKTPTPEVKVKSLPGAIQHVFVLGASIGGPEAVREFLSELPANFPALFVLAQHMGEEFLELMASQLAKATPLNVRRPAHNQRVEHGDVVVVPSTQRLQISAQGIISLSSLPQPSVYTPSIDQVIYDCTDCFGTKTTVIIFSGMARDAIEGSQYLADRGGKVWTQNPKTCVISSMVDGAQEAGIVSFVGSPKELAHHLLLEARGW